MWKLKIDNIDEKFLHVERSVNNKKIEWVRDQKYIFHKSTYYRLTARLVKKQKDNLRSEQALNSQNHEDNKVKKNFSKEISDSMKVSQEIR
jgi:hypothetical protein